MLPPGLHPATWDDLTERFGHTPRRQRLLRGLALAVGDLRTAGCARLYVDGSFVTRKTTPGDYDACWDPTGVTVARLHPVLCNLDGGRAAQKARYGGELFPSTALANARGATFLDFFQRDRDGVLKGLLALDLLGGRP